MTIENRATKTPRTRYYLELVVALATVVGLGATIYFSLHAEKSKRLEAHYLTKLSLISKTQTSKERVRVSYEDRDVVQLVQISLRLINAGTVPIEKRDIEQPAAFDFGSASILAATVVRRVPSSLVVTATSDAHRLVIDHGLLNPGDFVDVEVLCDGDPGWPEPTFRITGVREHSATILADDRRIVRPVYIELSRSALFAVLATATIAPVLSAFVGVLLIFEAWMPMRSAAKLRRAIRTAQLAGKADVPEALANHVSHKLLYMQERLASDEIRALRFDARSGESIDQFVDRAERAALEAIGGFWQRFKRTDWVEFLTAIGLLILSFSTALVLAGSWSSAWHLG